MGSHTWQLVRELIRISPPKVNGKHGLNNARQLLGDLKMSCTYISEFD
jgi:hypothetical protein